MSITSDERFDRFYLLPKCLEDLSDVLSIFDDSGQVDEIEYKELFEAVGALIKEISGDLKDHKKTYQRMGDRLFSKSKYKGPKKMMEDSIDFLGFAGFYTEVFENPDVLTQKKVEETTIDELLGYIPPIISVLDTRAMSLYGQDTRDIRRELDDRVAKRRAEMTA